MPIKSILSNFENVEEFFNRKSYLNPQKFWGYGIGRVDNGSKSLHENTFPEQGVYLTIFRAFKKILLFEFYQIKPNGEIQVKVLPDYKLDPTTITEIKIPNSTIIGRKTLFIYSHLFTNYIAIPTSNKETAAYYKSQIQLLFNRDDISLNELKSKIDSNYIHNKINTINSTEDSDLAIGLSKDLMETVCKTILSKNNIVYEKDWKTAKLIRECNKLLKLDLNEIDNSEKVDKSLKQILSGIGTTIQGITEIRNELGTGHGKEGSFVQIEKQDANLISSSVFQLSNFYLNHFEKELNL